MNIAEMHVYFRQYAQQMGMQNVRAILPEQIDVLLNTVISDKINKIIRENTSVTGDRVVTDGSKVSHINALAPLYKVVEIPINGRHIRPDVDVNFFVYDERKTYIGQLTSIDSLYNETVGEFPDYMYLIGFSVDYKDVIRGYIGGECDNKETPNKILGAFPVRFIDDSLLANTLQDFVMKPKMTSPIITMHDGNKITLYFGKFNRVHIDDDNYEFFLDNNYLPNNLYVSSALFTFFIIVPCCC